MTKRPKGVLVLGNIPSVAEHNWAGLPVMRRKKVSVRVMAEAFWTGVEVINNRCSWNRRPRGRTVVFFCVVFLKLFYSLKCVWTGVLR